MHRGNFSLLGWRLQTAIEKNPRKYQYGMPSATCIKCIMQLNLKPKAIRLIVCMTPLQFTLHVWPKQTNCMILIAQSHPFAPFLAWWNISIGKDTRKIKMKCGVRHTIFSWMILEIMTAGSWRFSTLCLRLQYIDLRTKIFSNNTYSIAAHWLAHCCVSMRWEINKSSGQRAHINILQCVIRPYKQTNRSVNFDNEFHWSISISYWYLILFFLIAAVSRQPRHCCNKCFFLYIWVFFKCCEKNMKWIELNSTTL